MSELIIRKKNGLIEYKQVDSLEDLREILKHLSNKDYLGWDIKYMSQAKQVKSGELDAFMSRRHSVEVSLGQESPLMGKAETDKEATLAEAGMTENHPNTSARLTKVVHQPVAGLSFKTNGARPLAMDDLRQGLQEMNIRFEALESAVSAASIEERLGAEAARLESAIQPALATAVDRVVAEVKGLLERFQDLKELVDDDLLSAKDIYSRCRPGAWMVLEQERDMLRHQVEVLRAESDQRTGKIDELERTVRTLRATTGIDEAELLEKRRASLEARERQLRSWAELETENADLRVRLEELEALRAKYQAHHEALSQDLRMQNENLRLTRELDQYKKDLLEARNRVDTLEVSERRVFRLLEAKKNLESDLSSERLARAELEAGAEQVQRDRARLQEQQREAETFIRTQQAQAIEDEARLRTILKKALQDEVRQELTQAVTGRDVAVARTATLEREVATLRDALALLERQEADRHSRNQALESDLRRLEARHTYLNQQVTDRERELQEIQARLTTPSRNLEALISEMEQQRIQRRAEIEAEVRVRWSEAQTELQQLRHEAKALAGEVESLMGNRGTLEAEIRMREEDLQVLRKDLEREKDKLLRLDVDRETRTASIREAVLMEMPNHPDIQNELAWLDQVEHGIKEAGFEYPRRLLEAFHTSLKTASWSPLSALAGVSGTGKSELPRLYSAFGGIHFLHTAVQPNWDSPQDLFGFFNYMDGRYRATPLLRALRQASTQDRFKEQMLIILLDEMNLARVEQYFSEILSQLGSVRAEGHQAAPFFQVDVGLGEQERIFLPDNVLYVGTMNEDETTLTLSDKVLDRGNLLTFPRPKQLKSRARVEIQSVSWRLNASVWRSWIQDPDKSLDKDVRSTIHRDLNEINEALGLVGRAIGHRVLQAIEAYVVNHPKTRAAEDGWRIAFGDQLAQRIMPKLRGLENDGDAPGECLARIRSILEGRAFELVEDYDHARRDHTFRWASAGYLLQ